MILDLSKKELQDLQELLIINIMAGFNSDFGSNLDLILDKINDLLKEYD